MDAERNLHIKRNTSDWLPKASMTPGEPAHASSFAQAQQNTAVPTGTEGEQVVQGDIVVTINAPQMHQAATITISRIPSAQHLSKDGSATAAMSRAEDQSSLQDAAVENMPAHGVHGRHDHVDVRSEAANIADRVESAQGPQMHAVIRNHVVSPPSSTVRQLAVDADARAEKKPAQYEQASLNVERNTDNHGCTDMGEGSRRTASENLLDASSSAPLHDEDAQQHSEPLPAGIAPAQGDHGQHAGGGDFARASADSTHSTMTNSGSPKPDWKRGSNKAAGKMAAKTFSAWHLVERSKVSTFPSALHT
jgi:hypothetical protein